jgi:elongator complex protein 1
MESDQEKYLECILTSQAKQSPQLLEEAMKIIYKKKESNPKDAEKAIKYLIFLADVNLLFNVALGIYDFPLVLMVAQHSQKDPREYLSFLEELNKHEINYRKFKIDNHLEKYPKALANLATAVAINGALMPEFIDFMKQHCLYRHAMFLFADKSKSHQVLVLYAEYLNSQNKFKDSGLVYELAGEFQKAANLYLEGLETKLYIGAVLKLDLTDENATQSYQQLCDKLIASSKYEDAAFVYTEYLKDDISAVKMLTRASMWQEALLKANNDIQIIDLEIKPHMINYCKNLVADLDNDIVSHEKNVADLESFRKKKKDMLASFADIEIMNDSASMATTVLTSISAFTARTGYFDLM